MRHLVTVQKIRDITPIENADRIVLATVLGWHTVVPKGAYKMGDLCVYFEIDSFLPIRDEFEFLRSSCFKKNEIMGEGFLVRTAKLRGQISQGLVMSPDEVNAILDEKIDFSNPDIVGMDLTEMLGVREYEEPEMASGSGTIIGMLPYCVPETDETRIQVVPEIIREFGNMEYYITTKMDGSSHSICVDENGVVHCTTHLKELKDDGNSVFWNMMHKMSVPEKLKKIREDKNLRTITLQGELCGPGIQRNRLKLKGPHWYLFTVIEDEKRLSLYASEWYERVLGVEFVPVEEIDVRFGGRYPDEAAILKRAEGEYPNGGQKEGIVIRPTRPTKSETLGAWLSIKAINNKYLLKNKE